MKRRFRAERIARGPVSHGTASKAATLAGAFNALVLFAIVAGPLAAQQRPTEEQIARAQALASPGPEHELLARMAGTWDQTVRIWPEPGEEAMTAHSVAENRVILGGRFVESRVISRMQGFEIEGLTILGFDRRHGEYTAVGFDSSDTYYVVGRGEMQADGWIVMRGTDEQPMLGHTQEYAFRLRFDDEDTYRYEVVFFDEMHTRGGGPFRMVEIVSRRRGA